MMVRKSTYFSISHVVKNSLYSALRKNPRKTFTSMTGDAHAYNLDCCYYLDLIFCYLSFILVIPN